MSEAKQAVTVSIAGVEHVIRANAEPEYTRRCARYVDQRIHEIRSRAGAIDAQKVAILAALSITDEFFQAQAAVERERSGQAAAAGRLSDRLEKALAES